MKVSLCTILAALVVVFAGLVFGFLLGKTLYRLCDKKEEGESQFYEESSTTEEPSTTTPPTIPPLPQELEERMKYLESEINRLWHTILRIR